MPDFLTKDERSRLMSKIRGKGNQSTELAFAKLLRKRKIRGWRRHARLPGSPDFWFPSHKLCVFLHGCFWHVCPKCFRMPTSNRKYWKPKFERNVSRDKRVQRKLRRMGYSVFKVWECQLANPELSIRIADWLTVRLASR